MAGMVMQNQILEAVEQKIEASLTPENRQNYMKIVVAGMKVGMANGDKSILASLQHSKNPLSDCVNGAINLCLMLKKESSGTMPGMAFVPAAMTLMIKALDFADRAGIIKVGQPELVQATHQFADVMFQRVGISKSMLQTAASKVHAITQDPAQLQRLHQVSGGGANGAH